jgi:hypothetical protein
MAVCTAVKACLLVCEEFIFIHVVDQGRDN